MNMDYSICQALAYNTSGLSRVLICYDIMCQYWVRFLERVERGPYLRIPHGIKFHRAIGQFHIHGHQNQCFPRFSPGFIQEIGQVDGEVIETLWAPLNLISRSTRSMTTAHRQEVIDGHMNDSNWKKHVRMGKVNSNLPN